MGLPTKKNKNTANNSTQVKQKLIQQMKNKYPGLTNKSKSLFMLMDIMNI